MRISENRLPGLFVIDVERRADERGFLARTFCAREFAAAGLPTSFVQCNVSASEKKGTLRGMHFQREPHAEGKLVTCTRGRIFDVVVDLRRDSPTYCEWAGFELSAHNKRLLYIPPGFAHGFQTLEDDSDVFYQMTEFYHPEFAAGVRWDDPAFGIEWPPGERIISVPDLTRPDFER